MKDLRGRDGVNIDRVAIGRNQIFIAGECRQNTEFNLRVVRVHKDLAGGRHKDGANTTPHLRANGNILQIRIGRGDTPRRRNGLVEAPVNSAVRLNIGGKSQCIGRIQLREHAVAEYFLDDRIFRRKFLQNIRGRRITALGLFPIGQFHLVEQNFAELFRRIQIKLFSGFRKYFILDPMNLALQFVREGL